MPASGKKNEPMETSNPTSHMPRWLDAATAILLSGAGLVSAWASYQAALWGGLQASHYTLATAKLTEASRLSIKDGQATGLESAMFVAWLNAASDNDERRMKFFERRFPPELRAPFERWRALLPADLSKAKALGDGPVAIPRLTHEQGRKAEALRKAAAVEFQAGETANSHGDRYTMATVILSLALFLSGISPLLRRDRARIAVLAMAAALGVAATVYIALLPVAAL